MKKTEEYVCYLLMLVKCSENGLIWFEIVKISDFPAVSPFETVLGDRISSIVNPTILEYAQALRVSPLKNQINFLNRLTFFNKHI